MRKQRVLPDLTGKKFNWLLVESYSHTTTTLSGRNKRHWVCRCDCGSTCVVLGEGLKSGNTKSCGCLLAKITAARCLKHGEQSGERRGHSRIYRIWCAMLTRCRNPRSINFKYYGGRGVTVCARWLDFRNFYADMGDALSATHSIDRINNDGNYELGNCRWSTPKEQANNRRMPA
jgi:hypothetical protein